MKNLTPFYFLNMDFCSISEKSEKMNDSFQELNNVIKNAKNFKKNKNMASLLTSFEDLCKAYTKALPVVQKEEGGKTPRFFIRSLCELNEFINQMWEDRESRKKMSKNNAKSLTTLR